MGLFLDYCGLWLVYPAVPRQHLWTLDTLPISSLTSALASLHVIHHVVVRTLFWKHKSHYVTLTISKPFTRPQLSSVQLQHYLMWQKKPFVTSGIWSFYSVAALAFRQFFRGPRSLSSLGLNPCCPLFMKCCFLPLIL